MTYLLRYEIIADALNYDARMRRVHWALALSHPEPASAESLAAASGVPASTAKDKLRYMKRQGVVMWSPAGWEFTDLGLKWLDDVHAEMERVARGGARFSEGLLTQIEGIRDAQYVNFGLLRELIFWPLLSETNKITKA